MFVSADGIPDFIRENRAILVATSAGSHSSGTTSLGLSSTSSYASLDIVPPRPRYAAASNTARGSSAVLRLHCRICRKDPCEDMTATICGHLFCKRYAVSPEANNMRTNDVVSQVYHASGHCKTRMPCVWERDATLLPVQARSSYLEGPKFASYRQSFRTTDTYGLILVMILFFFFCCWHNRRLVYLRSS